METGISMYIQIESVQEILFQSLTKTKTYTVPSSSYPRTLRWFQNDLIVIASIWPKTANLIFSSILNSGKAVLRFVYREIHLVFFFFLLLHFALFIQCKFSFQATFVCFRPTIELKPRRAGSINIFVFLRMINTYH